MSNLSLKTLKKSNLTTNDEIIPIFEKIDEILSNKADIGAELTPSQIEGIKGDKGDTGDKGEIGPKGDKGDKGDSYILTNEDKNTIASKIKIPVVEKIIKEVPIVTNNVTEVAVTDTPIEIKDKLESLTGEDRLNIKSISGVDELLDEVKKSSPTIKNAGLSRYAADSLYVAKGAALENSFETVSSNLSSYNYSLNYNLNGDITSIVYSNGVTKTFNYTGDNITSIVLSGSTPSGISLTKTLSYTAGDISGVTYS